MKKIIPISILVIIGLIVSGFIFSSIFKVDITGGYTVKVNGEYTGTKLVVFNEGSKYRLVMEGERNLKATYVVPKSITNRYNFQDIAGHNKLSEYNLHATSKGLEGTVWVLPLGKVEILFEKNNNKVSK
ncbi:MAG: hypothetical protein AB1798_09175 [Spirochaetota bacterium]